MTILKNMFELKREMEERKIKENKATYNIILNPLQLGASKKKITCIVLFLVKKIGNKSIDK